MYKLQPSLPRVPTLVARSAGGSVAGLNDEASVQRARAGPPNLSGLLWGAGLTTVGASNALSVEQPRCHSRGITSALVSHCAVVTLWDGHCGVAFE